MAAWLMKCFLSPYSMLVLAYPCVQFWPFTDISDSLWHFWHSHTAAPPSWKTFSINKNRKWWWWWWWCLDILRVFRKPLAPSWFDMNKVYDLCESFNCWCIGWFTVFNSCMKMRGWNNNKTFKNTSQACSQTIWTYTWLHYGHAVSHNFWSDILVRNMLHFHQPNLPKCHDINIIWISMASPVLICQIAFFLYYSS